MSKALGTYGDLPAAALASHGGMFTEKAEPKEKTSGLWDELLDLTGELKSHERCIEDLRRENKELKQRVARLEDRTIGLQTFGKMA